MDHFKDAIFCYEDASVPDELKVIGRLYKLINSIPQSGTLVHLSQSLETAAETIDEFKARTCGSPYSLAIINLNEIKTRQELLFLLRTEVLGDPRTIFLSSLRHVNDQVYALAKEKVMFEANDTGRSPSCIDCYSANNRDELCARASKLACAYIREAEERQNAKRSGLHAALTPKPATDMLKRSATAFHGRKSERFRSNP